MKKNRTWKLLMLCIIVILEVCISSNFTSTTYGRTESVNPVNTLYQNITIIGKIDDNTEEIISDCNNEIYNYFDNINIDVSKDLCKLNNNIFLFEENSDLGFSLTGFYNSLHTNNIYLNKCLLDDINYLKFTYVHEVMHYLGFADGENTMLMEGMADAITEDILGYYYEGAYDVPRDLCHQILISDLNVIRYLLNGGNLGKEIDFRLKDIYVDPSYVLNYNLTQIEYGELDAYTFDNYVNSCQEIISTYCDTFYLTDEQYEEIEVYKIF